MSWECEAPELNCEAVSRQKRELAGRLTGPGMCLVQLTYLHESIKDEQ